MARDGYGNYIADMGPQPTNPPAGIGFTLVVAGNPTTLGTVGLSNSFAFDSVGLTLYFTADGTTWTSVAGSGSGGTLTTLAGNGSPEGVVTGSPGWTYTQVDTGSVWVKLTGTTTNTGWLQVIA